MLCFTFHGRVTPAFLSCNIPSRLVLFLVSRSVDAGCRSTWGAPRTPPGLWCSRARTATPCRPSWRPPRAAGWLETTSECNNTMVKRHPMVGCCGVSASYVPLVYVFGCIVPYATYSEVLCYLVIMLFWTLLRTMYFSSCLLYTSPSPRD